MPRRAAAVVFALVAVAAPARASQLVDRNATRVTLDVDAAGRALVGYRAGGRTRQVLAWGAVDAVAPAPGRKQVSLRFDRRPLLRAFRNRCRPYRGPRLVWLVAACTAPDGSSWALQSWQRTLPNYGGSPEQAPWELRLSHWSAAVAQLRVSTDWAYGRFVHLFGRLTYRGRPVYGFRSTRRGAPLDAFGRNVYIDTFASVYGGGWRRENGILTHAGTGAFCYGFYPHGSRPAGAGVRFRITASGPGVTPDVMWEGLAPAAYVPRQDSAANARIAGLGDPTCRPN